MGLSDMDMSGFDADAQRYDRMNRMNTPDFAPGQDATFQQTDVFSSSSVSNNGGQIGDIFSSNPMGGGGDMFSNFSGGMGGMGGMTGMGASPNSMQMMQPQQSQSSTSEEKFWNAATTVGKGSMNFAKEFASSLKDLTPRYYSQWGYTLVKASACIAAGGAVGVLFGGGALALDALLGGLLSAAGGVVLWFFNTDAAKNYNSEYKSECNGSSQSVIPAPAPQPMIPQTTPMLTNPNPFGDMSGGMNNFTDMGGFIDDEDSGDSDDSGDYDSDSDYDDDYDDYDDGDLIEEDTGSEGMDTTAALDSLPQLDPGVYTRQFLWEMFTKVLPTMKPNFADLKEIDEDEDVFAFWESKLQEAAQVSGCKEDYLPDLLKLQENLFTIIVTCNRPQGFKEDKVATELANIYAYKDGDKNEGVFAKYDNIGAECRITIFNGAGAMISLKDMMLKQEDFIKDTHNYMPVCLGVDQLGKVIVEDFKKLESVIIAGMPRSGKSWFVQAVLTQMCAFVPPSELNIYICDPKEGISDFKSFSLPHVKKFVSGDDNIVNALRDVVKVEAPRRKRIIGDAGNVNIWDFKEENPDVKLPVIYVVIDEVVTLAERMEKETKKEFQGLLVELISQLPALGIRAFLIPHVVKNDIIAKTASDLVNCRISVCGDAGHIEAVTGAKPKDFPYKLFNKGDMAMKLSSNPNTLYIHGPALTESNPKNNKIFTYLRKVWARLEPTEFAGSVAESAQEAEDINNLASQSLDDSLNDEDLFNSNDSGDEDLDLF